MDDRKSFATRFHFLFGSLMVIIYGLAGIFLIFVWAPPGLPLFNRRILGVALLLYAFWRAYQLIVRKARAAGDQKTDENS